MVVGNANKYGLSNNCEAIGNGIGVDGGSKHKDTNAFSIARPSIN